MKDKDDKEDREGGDSSMEERILASAERLFLSKGYNLTSMTEIARETGCTQALSKGYNLTSMTEIARETGCTQALVHYYFRTKENLFSKIFESKFHQFIGCIVQQEDEELPFEELISARTSRLFDLMADNQRLPFMFLSEFVINPEQRLTLKDSIFNLCAEATSRLEAMIATEVEKGKDSIFNLCAEATSRLEAMIATEVEKGRIRPTGTMDITLNMFSLVVTFFVVLPFLEDMGLVTDANREEFIAQRKQEIIRTIIGSLKP